MTMSIFIVTLILLLGAAYYIMTQSPKEPKETNSPIEENHSGIMKTNNLIVKKTPPRIHAWFSRKQFEKSKREKEGLKAHLYYQDEEGKWVQVTEVTESKKNNSFFDDTVYLGIVTQTSKTKYL